MACYALASLKETIKLEFLQPNHRVSLDDDEAPKSLFEKLSSMQDFLSEKSESGGVVVRDLEIKIRDFALKTEDDIEIQLSNILQPAKDTENQNNIYKKLHQTLREVAEGAKGLLKIINDRCNEVEVRNVVQCGSSICTPELEAIMVVNQHRNFIDATKDFILRKYQERAVVPIFGMSGIGKTTSAKMMYEDPFVATNFDIKAWVAVSHECNLQQILRDLLHSMMPTITISEGSTLLQLKEQLYKHLKDKRYFIVLDDVWNIQDFNNIQQCFPNDQCGNCILLTTLFIEVVTNSYSNFWFTMKLLNKDESWDLFCNKLSLEQHMSPKFEKIAKHVVKQCEGLPRSIVVVAERLSKCNYSLKEWKKVKKEIDSLGTLYRDAQYSHKLRLLYNHLSQNMKICFSYFAIFPKGSPIQVKKLIRLWIADGFVESFEHKALEYVAYEYLVTFVSKSLVLAYKAGFDYEIKTCWMHDALHSFCVREAQKEGLFCAVNTRQCVGWSLSVLANSFRWLSLRSHNLDYYVFFSTNKPRSLFFFHGDPKMIVPFKLLRTLDFGSSLVLKSVPLRLGDYCFLRYLCVPQWVECLDDVVASNKNLQTLIISGVKSKHRALSNHLSSIIWELPQLCYLELGNTYTVEPPNMDKGNLETLSWAIPTHLRKVVHYCKFPNLRNLKIVYEDVFESSGTRGSCKNPIIILENIEYLSRLENLNVVVPIGSITLVQQPVFPAYLNRLSLRETNLPMNVLRVISQLPYLQKLKLENAFCGNVWEVVEGEFIRLQYLLLESRNLERWVVDATCFQNLKHLTLRRCYFLQEIPHGFVEMPKLWSIKSVQCPSNVVASAMRIHEEAKDKRNTIIHVFIDGEYYRYRNIEKSSNE